MTMTAQVSFIEELDFLSPKARIWGEDYKVYPSVFEPADILTSTELNDLLDTSLLRWPYFSLLREGAVPALNSYTKDRNVIGSERDGFADARAIRDFMAQGATLKLNKLSDWHRPSRAIVSLLEDRLPVAVASYAFWTPHQGQGMLPHRDGSHVFVMQLEGAKRWQLFAGNPSDVRAEAGLDVQATSLSHDFLLEPGDVLYLPHGWPHVTRTESTESSLHLTFTLTTPTPEALLEAFADEMALVGGSLIDRFHSMSLNDRAEATKSFLEERAASVSESNLANRALRSMKKNEG